MRRKSTYKSIWATYIDGENRRISFYCDEISIDLRVTELGGQPTADEGAMFITDAEIDFKARAHIQIGDENPRRILSVRKRPQAPEVGDQITTSMRSVAKGRGRSRIHLYDKIITTT